MLNLIFEHHAIWKTKLLVFLARLTAKKKTICLTLGAKFFPMAIRQTMLQIFFIISVKLVNIVVHNFCIHIPELLCTLGLAEEILFDIKFYSLYNPMQFWNSEFQPLFDFTIRNESFWHLVTISKNELFVSTIYFSQKCIL